jgi:hypothetical protein
VLLWPERKSGNDVGDGVVKFSPLQNREGKDVIVDCDPSTEDRQGECHDIL